ncbi:molybdate ABC transporter substrate-binding protein [Bacillus sp. DTU_2020_1000418_1_SI_GHA_SEK_038]|uniref:molybdate ABC transporter substrate-binding protein n=1 Tax=Bacillus sp. DTU_2020_1000418_1_SI_GHA_SEK_038 TaxID=3077585 RepID=UPI0028E2AC37|nr:molybdate ABC transporter substrate-binding protein [Bacillus sp. DTU_2020_1000418_1_SI_GHA_SEK_038]WNS73506.1 molybdate ABC transporter substrate-binding protein [Bacillus sp. DTU_2020_1000418_1_SI_GHA_SEK_038]
MEGKFFKIFILCFLIVLGGCTSDKQDDQSNRKIQANIELTISAAASLEDAFIEIKPFFEEEHKNIKLYFNFGGSGALQKQIIQGAPVDLFFSAAEDKFDELVAQGIIAEDHSMDRLENTLVLIIPKESNNPIEGFNELANLGDRKMALGTPEVVPAGNYGRQALEYLNLWDQAQGNIVFAKDVRQVLTYVETGNVDAGIVYKTDAKSSNKVRVVAEANSSSHDPIIYPVGIIKTTKHLKEAELFYQFLQEKKAAEVFVKYGFNVLD